MDPFSAVRHRHPKPNSIDTLHQYIHNITPFHPAPYPSRSSSGGTPRASCRAGRRSGGRRPRAPVRCPSRRWTARGPGARPPVVLINRWVGRWLAAVGRSVVLGRSGPWQSILHTHYQRTWNCTRTNARALGMVLVLLQPPPLVVDRYCYYCCRCRRLRNSIHKPLRGPSPPKHPGGSPPAPAVRLRPSASPPAARSPQAGPTTPVVGGSSCGGGRSGGK